MSTLETIIMCHVYERMRDRKPDTREKLPVKRCMLCDRHYCSNHKNEQADRICEIDHRTYYAKHPRLHSQKTIWPIKEAKGKFDKEQDWESVFVAEGEVDEDDEEYQKRMDRERQNILDSR